MSVTITLTEQSQVIIMFSATAYVPSPGGGAILIRALVGPTAASPEDAVFIGANLNDAEGGQAQAFNFYGTFDAGSYTVTMQWWTTGGIEGRMMSRSLVVFALPTS